MIDFTFRNPSADEELISKYESFIEDIRDGYGMCLSEYTNDLSCRDTIEERMRETEFSPFLPAIEQLDSALRSILIPTDKCIHGNYPKSAFWYWGYPPDSPELYADLLSCGIIAK